MLSRSESRLPYACRQKIASIERAASIRSGMILRSFPLSLPRSAVRRTVVYWASFLSMGESVAAELLARAFAGSLRQALNPAILAANRQTAQFVSSIERT
jgi:hypothetical protein